MPPGTFSSSPAPAPEDTSPEYSPNGNWHLCSRRACREHCQSHSTRGHGSERHPYVPWPLAAARRPGRLRLWSWPALPLASSRRNLRRWGGRRARERGWKLFRPGPRPCQGARCDAMWQGHPTYSQGRGKYKSWRCSRRSHVGGLGDLDHISGRGHLNIPAHPVPSRLPWTSAPSPRPLSSLHVAVYVRIWQGTLLWYLPGPPPPAGRSASAPLSVPLGGRPSGP